jgi:hypothetical protein
MNERRERFERRLIPAPQTRSSWVPVASRLGHLSAMEWVDSSMEYLTD